MYELSNSSSLAMEASVGHIDVGYVLVDTEIITIPVSDFVGHIDVDNYTFCDFWLEKISVKYCTTYLSCDDVFVGFRRIATKGSSWIGASDKIYYSLIIYIELNHCFYSTNWSMKP